MTCVALLSRVSAEAPGIVRPNVDLRRCYVRVLSDGQGEDRANAAQHDDNRQHPCEDRPFDEDAGQARGLVEPSSTG